MSVGVMTTDTKFSHDGLHDQLTHSAAPPLFYSHLTRLISGCARTGAPLTLISFSISPLSRSEQVVAMAHAINLVMRQEDLCGRTGSYEFVIVVSGDLTSGKKLIERVRNETSLDFSCEQVKWVPGETALNLLLRLDLEAERPPS